MTPRYYEQIIQDWVNNSHPDGYRQILNLRTLYLFCMRDTLTQPIHLYLPPSPQTDPDIITHTPPGSAPASKSAIWKKVALGTLLLSILLGLLFTICLFQDQNRDKEVGSTPYPSHYLTVDAPLEDVMTIKNVSGMETGSLWKITGIILEDYSVTEFQTTLFPNLNFLSIGKGVHLDSLVINNSQLTEFSYSSPDLRSLKLINNAKMTTFINSSLPILEVMSVIKTSIVNWTNNKIGALKSLEFTESNIIKVPDLCRTVETFVLRSCGSVSAPDNIHSYLPNAQSIQIVNNLFSEAINIIGLKSLQSFHFINNTVLKSVLVSNCSVLEEVVVEGQAMLNLTLQDLPKLYYFFPKVQMIEMITLINTNISQFIIETTFLDILTIQGPNPRKIQPNITHLTEFHLYDNLMNDTEFTLLSLPSVTRMIISNCSNLKKLSNSFPRLHFLDLDYLSNPDFSSLKLPLIQQLKTCYSNYTTFEAKGYPLLKQVEIYNSSLEKIIVQQPCDCLTLHNIEKEFQFVLNNSNIKMIDIQNTPSFSLQSHNLPMLQFLGVQFVENATIVNNTFTHYMSSLGVSYVQNQFVFQNNILPFDVSFNSTVLMNYINNFKDKGLNFTGVTNTHFDGNNIKNITEFLPQIPDAQFLCLANNSFASFSGLNNSNITTLYLDRSYTLSTFSSNTLLNIKVLGLADCINLAVFSNNTLPHLVNLQISGTGKLKNEDLLAELRSWKSKGTELESISFGDRGSEFPGQVRELFPNIIIE